jgi:hypothetical protein
LRKPAERICLLLAAGGLLLGHAKALKAQDSQTPSVADAAKSARQKQKSTVPARVLNTEDVTPALARCPPSPRDQQLRADLEIAYHAPLTAPMARAFQTDADAMAGFSQVNYDAEERNALRDYMDVPFPGRSEWEDRLRHALDSLIEERKELAETIRSIEDENRALIAGGNNSPESVTRLEAVRQKLIDAVMPERRCEVVLGQVKRDGMARAKAYKESAVSPSTPHNQISK